MSSPRSSSASPPTLDGLVPAGDHVANSAGVDRDEVIDAAAGPDVRVPAPNGIAPLARRPA